MTTPSPRAVELVRVSSAGQSKDATPEAQRKKLDDLARTRPRTLVRRIELGAKGMSGALPLSQRPDLLELLDLAGARAFDEVRVYDLSRLTRTDSMSDAGRIFDACREAGARIVGCDGSVIDPATSEGRLMFGIGTWSTAEERKRIVTRTLDGRKRKAASGIPMGKLPYARRYDRKSGTWSIDEGEAAIYRSLFADLLAGRSLREIVARLDREGAPTPEGGKWNATRVMRLVRNPGASGKTVSYGFPVECPAIVDEGTQRRAIARMEGNKLAKSGAPGSAPALLRKLATCAECGKTMWVASHGHADTKALYYRCGSTGGRRRADPSLPEACRAYHRVEKVDAVVMEALRAYVERPEALARGRQAKNGDAGKLLAEADKALRDLDAREERLVRLFTTGSVSETVYGRQRAEVTTARKEAQARRDALAEEVRAADEAGALAVEARDAVEALRKRVKRATPAEWRALAEAIFPRGPTTWVRIEANGTVRLRGLLKLGSGSELLPLARSWRRSTATS